MFQEEYCEKYFLFVEWKETKIEEKTHIKENKCANTRFLYASHLRSCVIGSGERTTTTTTTYCVMSWTI